MEPKRRPQYKPPSNPFKKRNIRKLAPSNPRKSGSLAPQRSFAPVNRKQTKRKRILACHEIPSKKRLKKQYEKVTQHVVTSGKRSLWNQGKAPAKKPKKGDMTLTQKKKSLTRPKTMRQMKFPLGKTKKRRQAKTHTKPESKLVEEKLTPTRNSKPFRIPQKENDTKPSFDVDGFGLEDDSERPVRDRDEKDPMTPVGKSKLNEFSERKSPTFNPIMPELDSRDMKASPLSQPSESLFLPMPLSQPAESLVVDAFRKDTLPKYSFEEEDSDEDPLEFSPTGITSMKLNLFPIRPKKPLRVKKQREVSSNPVQLRLTRPKKSPSSAKKPSLAPKKIIPSSASKKKPPLSTGKSQGIKRQLDSEVPLPAKKKGSLQSSAKPKPTYSRRSRRKKSGSSPLSKGTQGSLKSPKKSKVTPSKKSNRISSAEKQKSLSKLKKPSSEKKVTPPSTKKTGLQQLKIKAKPAVKSDYNLRKRKPKAPMPDYAFLDDDNDDEFVPMVQKKDIVKKKAPKRMRQTTLTKGLGIELPNKSPPKLKKQRRRSKKKSKPKPSRSPPPRSKFFRRNGKARSGTPTRSPGSREVTPSSIRISKRHSLSQKPNLLLPKKLEVNSKDSDSEDEPPNPVETKPNSPMNITNSSNNMNKMRVFITKLQKRNKKSMLGEVIAKVLENLPPDKFYSELAEWFEDICRAESKVLYREEHTRTESREGRAKVKEKEISMLEGDDLSLFMKDQEKRKNPGKTVRFCCADLSAIPPPTVGKTGGPKMFKVQEQVIGRLTQAFKKAKNLFRQKSGVHKMKTFKEKLEEMIGRKAFTFPEGHPTASTLLHELEKFIGSKSKYPFHDRLVQLQSSHIRFYLKTIFNCTEYTTVDIPEWFTQFGSWVESEAAAPVQDKEEEWFLDENEKQSAAANTEAVKEASYFVNYHAAELAINLQSFDLANQADQELPLDDDIPTFFRDFYELAKQNPQILGHFSESQEKLKPFDKYLYDQWSALKSVVSDLASTESDELAHFIPLAEFPVFLESFFECTNQ